MREKPRVDGRGPETARPEQRQISQSKERVAPARYDALAGDAENPLICRSID